MSQVNALELRQDKEAEAKAEAAASEPMEASEATDDAHDDLKTASWQMISGLVFGKGMDVPSCLLCKYEMYSPYGLHFHSCRAV